MKEVIFKDNMMNIESNHHSCLYHEVEIQSEMNGELESVTIDKSAGKIVIRFKRNNRENRFDDDGNYVKPLDKDRNFKLSIIEN